MEPMTIQPHNSIDATTWRMGSAHYERISRSIAEAIEHCVNGLATEPGEHILDVAMGPPKRWPARPGAPRCANE